MTEYLLFTLNTAQEIIAEVVAEHDDMYVVRKPHLICIVPTTNTQYELQLVPLSPADPDGDKRVYKTAIGIESVNIPSALVKMYQQQTSMIEIATSFPGQM